MAENPRASRFEKAPRAEEFVGGIVNVPSTDGIHRVATTASGAQLFAEVSHGRMIRFLGRDTRGEELVPY